MSTFSFLVFLARLFLFLLFSSLTLANHLYANVDSGCSVNFRQDFGLNLDPNQRWQMNDIGSTDFTLQSYGVINSGEYILTSKIDTKMGGFWYQGIKDATSTVNGGFMIVNGSSTDDKVVYESNTINWTEGETYKVSFYAMNASGHVNYETEEPNLKVTIKSGKDILKTFSTGNIAKSTTGTWQYYSFVFKATASSGSIVIQNTALQPNLSGNDFALDEIMIQTDCDPDDPDRNADTDGDGIVNNVDIDDDNDGILDTDEGVCSINFRQNFGANLDPNKRWPMNDMGSTDFTYKDKGSIDFGEYSITSKIDTTMGNFWYQNTRDVTGTINGGFMIVNGSSTDDKVVYESNTINWTEGETYKVSFYAMNSSGHVNYETEEPNLKVTIKSGEDILKTFSTGNIAKSTTGTWQYYSFVFKATTSSGSIIIQDTGLQPNLSGNDFALDEIVVQGGCHSDNDGIPNYRDLDSDNDGIPDNVEAQTTVGYVAPSGKDSNSNGLDDAYEQNTNSIGLKPVNTDGVDEPDFLDLDSDNDGLFDLEESGLKAIDENQDGLTDNPVGKNGLDNTLESTDNYSDPNGNINNPKTDLRDIDQDASKNIPLKNDVDYRDNALRDSISSGSGDSSNTGSGDSSNTGSGDSSNTGSGDSSNTGSGSNIKTVDATFLATIQQKSTQADPVVLDGKTSVAFEVNFQHSVTGYAFSKDNIVITKNSTATGIVIESVTEIAPNDGTHFEVIASATGAGTIQLDLNFNQNSYNIPAALYRSTTDNQGNLYLSAYDNEDSKQVGIFKITPDAKVSSFYPDKSMGVITTKDNVVYGRTFSGTEMVKITPDGKATILSTLLPTTSPLDLSIDSQGNVFAAISRLLYKIDANNNELSSSTIDRYISSSISMVIDSKDNLYLLTKYGSSTSNHTIFKVSPEGDVSKFATDVYYKTANRMPGLKIYNDEIYYLQGNDIYKVTQQAKKEKVYTMTSESKPSLYNVLGFDIDQDGKLIIIGIDTKLTPNASQYITFVYNPVDQTTQVLGQQQYTYDEPVLYLAAATAGGIYTYNVKSGKSGQVYRLAIRTAQGTYTPAESTATAALDNIVTVVTEENSSPPLLPTTAFPAEIYRKSTQFDPAVINDSGKTKVTFEAAFSDSIKDYGFAAKDIVISPDSTAQNIVIESITEIEPYNGTRFDVVASATSQGTIKLILGANRSTYAIPPEFKTSHGYNLSHFSTTDDAGNIYFSSYNGANVLNGLWKLTPDGDMSLYYETERAQKVLTWKDMVYTNTDSGLVKITPDGKATTLSTSSNQRFLINSQGDLFTIAETSYTVDKIDHETGATTSLTSTTMPYKLTSIAIDSQDNLYLLSNDNDFLRAYPGDHSLRDGTLLKITPSGTSSLFARGIKDDAKTGLKTHNNEVYYLDNNSIYKLDQLGNKSLVYEHPASPASPALTYIDDFMIDRNGNLIIMTKHSKTLVNANNNQFATLVYYPSTKTTQVIYENNSTYDNALNLVNATGIYVYDNLSYRRSTELNDSDSSQDTVIQRIATVDKQGMYIPRKASILDNVVTLITEAENNLVRLTNTLPAEIYRKSTQFDPVVINNSGKTKVTFEAAFSDSVKDYGFAAKDIVISPDSTAQNIAIESVTEIAPYDGTRFDVVASATSAGTIELSLGVNRHTYDPPNDLRDQSISDDSGNLYLASYNNNSIDKVPGGLWKINSRGEMSLYYTAQHVWHVQTKHNTIYATTSNGTIKIKPNGDATVLSKEDFEDPEFVNPFVVNSQGDLFGIDPNNYYIIKIDGETGVDTLFSSIVPYKVSRLTIDAQDNLYLLANSDDGLLFKVTPSGTTTLFAQGVKNTARTGIKTRYNEVYYLDNNSIYKLDRLGNKSLVYEHPDNPASPAFTDLDDFGVDRNGNLILMTRFKRNLPMASSNQLATLVYYPSTKKTEVIYENNSVYYTILSLVDTSGIYIAENKTYKKTIFNNGTSNTNDSSYDSVQQRIATVNKEGIYTPIQGNEKDNVATIIGEKEVDKGLIPVTINQKSTQADPVLFTGKNSVTFEVTFPESIASNSLTINDFVTTASTATGITIESINEVTPFDGTHFEVVVSATSTGIIQLSMNKGSTTQYTMIDPPTQLKPPQSSVRPPAITSRFATADNAGNLYVSINDGTVSGDIAESGIYKVSASGEVSLYYQTGKTSRLYIKNNQLYFFASQKLFSIDLDATEVKATVITDYNGTAAAFVVNSQGDIFVLPPQKLFITKIDGKTGVKTKWYNNDNDHYPSDIVIDEQDNLYIYQKAMSDHTHYMEDYTPVNYKQGVNSIVKYTPSKFESILVPDTRIYETRMSDDNFNMNQMTIHNNALYYLEYKPTDRKKIYKVDLKNNPQNTKTLFYEHTADATPSLAYIIDFNIDPSGNLIIRGAADTKENTQPIIVYYPNSKTSQVLGNYSGYFSPERISSNGIYGYPISATEGALIYKYADTIIKKGYYPVSTDNTVTLATAAEIATIAMNKIIAYANDPTQPAPTVQDYADAGITGVTPDILALVNQAIAALTGEDIDTLEKLQAVVNAVLSKSSLKLQVKALLQGPYSRKAALMNDDLRRLGLIPTEQPYQVKPFEYYGKETINPYILQIGGIDPKAPDEPDAPVDWVLIELWDKNTMTRQASQAAILQRDGDVADPQTNSTTLRFMGVPTDNYYVVLRHRNHLGVMTKNPVYLSTGVGVMAMVDFTSPSTAIAGKNPTLGGDEKDDKLRLLWVGDINADNRIISNGGGSDSIDILVAIISSDDNQSANVNFILGGYLATDLNMDGKTLFAGPNNDINILSGNVLLHPANSILAANFIINGTLTLPKQP